MAPRRSHHKSRQGCLNCKRRHVKCDESGPPCTNCKYRQMACEYDQPGSRASHAPSIACPTKPDQRPERDYATSRDQSRSTELRLLHRWSTVTYDSVTTEATNDWEIWQKTVPEVALNHDFLLNIIFALAAFEIAFSSLEDSAKYLSIAMEYQGLALRGFQGHLQSLVDRRPITSSDLLDVEEDQWRKQVTASLAEYVQLHESQIVQKNVHTLGIKLDDEQHDAILYASLLLMALTLASATAKTSGLERESTILQTTAYYDLAQSVNTVIMSKPDCVTTHELFRNVPDVYNPEMVALKEDVERVLIILDMLNEDRLAHDGRTIPVGNNGSWPNAISNKEKTKPDLGRKSSAFDDIKKLAEGLDNGTESTRPHYSACKNALIWLRYMFQTCRDKKLQAHCLAWPTMAGNEYIQAVKQADCIALLTLVGWAVLMQPLGESLWYGKDFGKLLVEDVAEALRMVDDEQVLSVLSWARKKVGNLGNDDGSLAI